MGMNPQAQKLLEKILTHVALFIAVAAVTGLFITELREAEARHRPWHTRCYSGSEVVYEIMTQDRPHHTDYGWYFVDPVTKKQVMFTGTCISEEQP